ncbi:hypothetical protein [Vibrio gallaecicus]|nr:hypothetical protein [Vibrio gallaecicus]MDN3614007.1 hypothetical protein [Vibrio gallaecicus]
MVACKVLVNSRSQPRNIDLANIRISGYLFPHHYKFNTVEHDKRQPKC